MEGVWGYDEDQVALVIPDSTGFGSQVLSYSGYTYHQLDHQCDQGKWNWWAVSSLNRSRIAQFLDCWWARLDSGGNSCKPTCRSSQLECCSQSNKEISGHFSSKISHGQTKTLLLGNNMYVMTQSLKGGDGLPLALWLECGEHIHQSDFWEQASHAVVVKNQTAISYHYCQGLLKSPKWLLWMWYPQ